MTSLVLWILSLYLLFLGFIVLYSEGKKVCLKVGEMSLEFLLMATKAAFPLPVSSTFSQSDFMIPLCEVHFSTVTSH